MKIEISPVNTHKYLPRDQALMYKMFFENNGRGWRFPTEDEVVLELSGLPAVVGWVWTKEKIEDEDYTSDYDVILVRDIKNA